MSAENIYYVYWIHDVTHVNPSNEGYVGITVRDVEKRFSEHMHSGRFPKNVVADVLNVLDSEEKMRYVEFWYRPEKHIGWNIAKGGESGIPDGPRNEETKQKIREARTGVPHDQSRKDKISRKLSGRKQSAETIYKRVSKTKGQKRPIMSKKMSGKNNPSSKEHLKPNREILSELYEKRLLSFVDIGNMFGVSNNTAKKWCTEENISIRTHSENQKIQSQKKRAAEAALVVEG